METEIEKIPFGESHLHIFMNGNNYKEAVKAQSQGVNESVIRKILKNIGSGALPGCGMEEIFMEPPGGQKKSLLSTVSPIAPPFLLSIETDIMEELWGEPTGI